MRLRCHVPLTPVIPVRTPLVIFSGAIRHLRFRTEHKLDYPLLPAPFCVSSTVVSAEWSSRCFEQALPPVGVPQRGSDRSRDGRGCFCSESRVPIFAGAKHCRREGGRLRGCDETWIEQRPFHQHIPISGLDLSGEATSGVSGTIFMFPATAEISMCDETCIVFFPKRLARRAKDGDETFFFVETGPLDEMFTFVLCRQSGPLDMSGYRARRVQPSAELSRPPYSQHDRLRRSGARGAARLD